eukprot:CAMPEP_0118953764 /NCGR_PEP_ID=MMETSP1169-20130426/57138_1 /TAXON_ID=36882 /ORGANISM="Pyramimonas obovata, Strain CCMP722" /LENGTH=185 /DNA_ID=CAMNT_0006901297 /DNA_START=457 /DNA_END=1011 /DNA_ORIENTATION=-
MEALTPYELERERQIARNREMMAKLNIPVLAANVPKTVNSTYSDYSTSELEAETAEARREVAKRKREEDETRLLLARRSLRARGIGPLEETQEELEERLETAKQARMEAERRREEREAALSEAQARDVATRGGRPVTWIGGGGQDPSQLARMGVPELRARFLQVFGQHTASNNSTWLRKKLAEPV